MGLISGHRPFHSSHPLDTLATPMRAATRAPSPSASRPSADEEIARMFPAGPKCDADQRIIDALREGDALRSEAASAVAEPVASTPVAVPWDVDAPISDARKEELLNKTPFGAEALRHSKRKAARR